MSVWETDDAANLSPDALDQWALGHGKHFLNSYKTETQVNYFAKIDTTEINAGQARTKGYAEFSNLFALFGKEVEQQIEAIKGAAEEIGPDAPAPFFKRLYSDLINWQRARDDEASLVGNAAPFKAADDGHNTPSGQSEQTSVITHTPLPLRSSQVSRCSTVTDASSPFEDDALPEFGFGQKADGELSFPTAVVGVIDDAINFTHQRFKAEWGTRTEFAWIQDNRALEPDGPGTPGPCRDRVYFGREYYRTEIDHPALLDGPDPDAYLRAFEQDPPQSVDRPVGYLHAAHGTHVADLATGYSADEHHFHDIRMISVQLPELAYFDNSGMAMSFFLLEGVKFTLWRALFMQIMMNIEEALQGKPADEWSKLPVVLNISYGLTGGPHSGGHYLEEGVDKLIEEFTEGLGGILNLGPVDVVVPTGNDFLNRRFASARRGDDTLNVTVRVPPKDRTSQFVEFWFPSEKGVKAYVTPSGSPDRTEIDFSGSSAYVLKDSGDVIARISLDCPFGQGQSLARVLLAIAPTDTQNVLGPDPRRPAQAGRWEITVMGQVGPTDVIEAYIHTEDPNIGFPRKDPPCYFEDALYRKYEDNYRDWVLADDGKSVVRRFGTLNGFGNGRFATVVGGYRLKSHEAALYSGAGRLLGQSYYGRTPTIMAPSDLSRLNPGILGAGTRSGASYIQTGTSVAAPLVARAIAEAAPDQTIQDVVENAAMYEEAIGYQPPIRAQQKGAGRHPLMDLSEGRHRQYLRGLYSS